MRERQGLEDNIEAIKRLQQSLDDNVELIAMGEEEDDAEIVRDAEASLRAMEDEVAQRRVETLLSGEMDASDTFLEVHAGAGGTESQDWAQMLLRMYTRWAERKGFKVEVQDIAYGEEAGIKGATLLVKGHNAHGWLKTESGVHRLGRMLLDAVRQAGGGGLRRAGVSLGGWGRGGTGGETRVGRGASPALTC